MDIGAAIIHWGPEVVQWLCFKFKLFSAAGSALRKVLGCHGCQDPWIISSPSTSPGYSSRPPCFPQPLYTYKTRARRPPGVTEELLHEYHRQFPIAMPPIHRPPGRGGGGMGTKFVLTFALFLLLAATTEQQSLKLLQKPPDPLVASTHASGRSPVPSLKYDITTPKFRSTDEDAVHHNNNAFAPAPRRPSAVRAPLAHPVESAAGLSPLTPARLLQDWEADDILLVATVDGRVQARNRKTGEKIWQLGFDDSPMVETIHHCHETEDGKDCGQKFMFIVEPSHDGTIFIQHDSPEPRLQRLGLTVKQLAAQTPNFVHNPPLITISDQQTSAIVVHAKTGTIVQQFSKHTLDLSNNEKERKCRRLTGLDVDQTDFDPRELIHLGRVEYTITIYNKTTDTRMCTIKYAEWTPNRADDDLQMQYNGPLDSLHIQTGYNGRIIGLDQTSPRPQQWQDKLDSPVAQIFDIVKPAAEGEQDQLVLLNRPLNAPSLSPVSAWQDDRHRLQRVWIDKNAAGSWYAMSEMAYPGVTAGGSLANIGGDASAYPIDSARNPADIIGVHTLSEADVDAEVPVRLTIDASAPSRALIPEPEKGMNASPAASEQFSKAKLTDAMPTISNLVLFSIILVFAGSRAQIPALRAFYRSLQQIPVLHSLLDSPTDAKPVPEPHIDEIVVPQPVDGSSERIVEEAGEFTANLTNDTGVLPTEGVTLQAAIMEPAMIPAAETEIAEVLPAKLSKTNSNISSEDESEDDKTSVLGVGDAIGRPKRKTKRGKRGGRKNRPKKTQMSPESIEVPLELAVESRKGNFIHVGKLKVNTEACLGRGSNGTTVFPGTHDGRAVAVKRLIRASNSLAEKEIKHLLTVDSHENVMRYIGREESRDFTYIALDLFTTSLDQFIEKPQLHPDLVDPIRGFDVKDCLDQITKGVSYLHSLKLVHRDIKPQNVLVRPVKTNRPVAQELPRLHFVISDFGLAKPLEEGPESMFAQTANQTAAGTTGWKAPELLENHNPAIPVVVNGTTAANSGSTNQSTEGDSTMDSTRHSKSTRRATKAIDIFSLGCLFYYIMTQGRHPFDVGGSLGRDLNVKEHRMTTEDLRFHDYEFEADDLILQMLQHEPKDRPDTQQILKHPYFWTHERKLEFMCEVSDRYEKEKNTIAKTRQRDVVRSPAELESLAELDALESLAPNVITGGDWLRALPSNFMTEAGKQRGYSGNKMIDLLRVVRNKAHHIDDLPPEVQEQMMSLALSGQQRGGTDGKEVSDKGQEKKSRYWVFFAKKFPSLLVNCHSLILERGLVGKMDLGQYYEIWRR